MSEPDHDPTPQQAREHLSATEARQQEVDRDLGTGGDQYIEQLENPDSGVGY